MRMPSEYKGKTFKLKKDSPTFLDILEENKTAVDKDESTAIVIEDWAKMYVGKKLSTQK